MVQGWRCSTPQAVGTICLGAAFLINAMCVPKSAAMVPILRLTALPRVLGYLAVERAASPETGQTVATDLMYCLQCIPLAVPAFLVFTFFTWTGLKFFRHN